MLDWNGKGAEEGVGGGGLECVVLGMATWNSGVEVEMGAGLNGNGGYGGPGNGMAGMGKVRLDWSPFLLVWNRNG